MTELVTSGSVGGMASNGCLYPEVATLRISNVRCANLTGRSRFAVDGMDLPEMVRHWTRT